MAHHAPAFRIGLYFALSLFSIILLSLTATRIHQTLHFGAGSSFYDPIVVELLVTSCLAIIWSWFIIYTIHSARTTGPIISFRHEAIGFFIIWIMFLVGTAIATNYWGNLRFCFGSFTCRILTDIVVFAWLCFIVMTVILIATMCFLASNDGYGSIDQPLHGRWGSALPTEEGPVIVTAESLARGPVMGTRAGLPAQGPVMGTRAGPPTEGAVMATRAGPPTEGAVMATPAGPSTEGPVMATRAGPTTEGPVMATRAGPTTEGPVMATRV